MTDYIAVRTPHHGNCRASLQLATARAAPYRRTLAATARGPKASYRTMSHLRRRAAPVALDRSRPQEYHSTWAGWIPPIGALLASGVEPPPTLPDPPPPARAGDGAWRPLSR